MCLYTIDSITAEVRDKLEQDGKIIGWKELEILNDDLLTLFRGARVERGINEAHGTIAYKSLIESGAIHVYLEKSDACIYSVTNSVEILKDSSTHVVSPVICRKEDFIAAGNFCACNVACFTKVEYPQNIMDILKEDVVEPRWIQ